MNCTWPVLLVFTFAAVVHAADDEGQFPFVIPWDDAEAGVATDVSFLNIRPAGANGHIVARGEHFVEETTGRPIRFLGTNLTAQYNFPTHDDAAKVARHMAKYGINIVRLHHMDNSWNLAKGTGIWKADDPRRLELDPDRLDRLDFLVAQLKQQGIYVNINLKVSKQLSEADGFPPAVTQLPWSYQKRVDIFNARMIELQKDFAHRLLTHVNPYTGLSYAEDPAVAVVEINNENSLVGFSSSQPGEGLANLPEPFRSELAQLWNAWLHRHYDSDEALAAAWTPSEPEDQPQPLSSDTRWSLAKQGKADAQLSFPEGDHQTVAASPQVTVTQVDGTDWHVQLHLPRIDIRSDRNYSLTFRAKASAPTTIRATAQRDHEDYRNLGLSQPVKLDTQWKDFTFAFKARNVEPNHARLTFNVGSAIATLQLADVQLIPGVRGAGLRPGESLAKANIDLPVAMSDTQRRDWVQFLVDTEHAYALEMRRFLRDELAVKAAIVDTQISWGGLTGYVREAEMDFADSHAYWQHPHFPGKSWDRRNWTIGNGSLVDAWAAGKTGTLDGLAMTRWSGRPFAVSEYDHPAPSDFAVETMPLVACFAAAQDWDAIYSFEYGPYGQSAAHDRITGFFDHANHPAKFAFYPATAMMFRAGLLTPVQMHRVLQLPSRAYDDSTTAGGVWRKAQAPTGIDAFLSHRWAVVPTTDPTVAMPAILESGDPTAADQTLRVDKVSAGGIFVASAPAAVVIVGRIGGETIHAGDVTVRVDPFPGNFAAITVTAMDRRPLVESKRVLVTIVGRAENLNMGWNATRTSVSDQWGTGPVQLLHVPAHFTMAATGARRVYALDPTGRRQHVLDPGDSNSSEIRFSTDMKHATVWYELAAD